MTTTSVDSFPADGSASSPTSTRPLRLLTQLRSYTHNHLSNHPLTRHRSYRESISRAVGRHPHRLSDPPSDPTTHQLEQSVSTQSAPENRAWAESEPSPRAEISEESSGTTGSEQSGSESPSPNSSNASDLAPSNEPDSFQPAEMVRNRAASATEGHPARTRGSNAGPALSTMPLNEASRTGLNSENAAAESSANAEDSSPRARRQPTIRLYSYQDPNQSSRPSLPFTTITRTLPRDSAVVRVGRYSERDGLPIPNPAQPSEAPVGFKSKVVSRKHCEFSYSNGQWHIKDVGSSSGTFLNHMRLSQPSMPSRLYAIRDGDIIQLGVDFKGGEEMIFRCVRIRLECNRAWQQRPNEFNKNTANLINNLGKGADADYKGCRECSICLGSVLRPYQCLFMAACAHVWHYKCIRRLIQSPEYPMFQCPNCRAYTDLSAEVDDTNDGYENDAFAGPPNARDNPVEGDTNSITSSRSAAEPELEHDGSANAGVGASGEDELVARASNMRIHAAEPNEQADGTTRIAENDVPRRTSSNRPGSSTGLPTPNIDIPSARQAQLRANTGTRRDGQSPGVADTFEDCPLTPRNDMGPLALDSRAGRL